MKSRNVSPTLSEVGACPKCGRFIMIHRIKTLFLIGVVGLLFAQSTPLLWAARPPKTANPDFTQGERIPDGDEHGTVNDRSAVTHIPGSLERYKERGRSVPHRSS